MKIKTLLMAVLTLVLITSLALFGVGCKDDQTNTTSGPKEPQITFNFTQTEMDVVIGDKVALPIEYTKLADKQPQYSSNNESVVSVSSVGEVTALLSGEATITATYEGKTASILVKSGFFDKVPLLKFTSSVNSTVELCHQGSVNLESYIYFNGKKYYDHQVEYTVDGECGQVQNNVFTADSSKANDSATIKVTATWRGYTGTLIQTIAVNVKNKIELFANDGSVEYELYTQSNFAGQSYTNQIDFVVGGKINDSTDIEPEVFVYSGEDYIVYDKEAETLKGVKTGSSIIRISYNGEYEDIVINVKPTIATYSGETYLFSAIDGTLPIMDIFGNTDVEIVSAVDGNGVEYTVVDNKIIDIPVDGSKKPDKMSLTISTDRLGYVMDIVAYTKVIRNAQDLEDAFRYDAAADGSLAGMTLQNGNYVLKIQERNGYYILANDINVESSFVYDVIGNGVAFENRNASGSVIKHPFIYWSHAYFSGGLTGTFDGDGHTISGLTVSDYGVFGMVNGGTIKNVGFEDVKYTGRYGNLRSTLGFLLFNATLENVYIETKCLSSTSWNAANTGIGQAGGGDARVHRSLVASVIGGNIKMNNCIFVCPEIDGTDMQYHYSYGSLCAFDFNTARTDSAASYSYQIKNTYIISPYALSVSTVWPNGSHIDTVVAQGVQMVVDSKDVDVSDYTGLTENKVYKSKDFIRYDDTAEMVDANNDYTSFIESGYWEILGDIPSWK